MSTHSNIDVRSVASSPAAGGALGAPPLPELPVVAVRARVFRAPVTDPVAMSFGPLGSRVMVLVEVELADGSVGTGETWANFPSWAWRERVATVREGLAPLLQGSVFTDPPQASARLNTALEPLGRQWGAPGPISQAISGVDVALWDLATRHAGTTLAGWLAAATGTPTAAEVPVYGSSLGPTGVRETAQACRDRGITRAKVKLGFGVEQDRANLEAARAVLGADAEIYGDANQAWSVEQAVAMAPLLRDHDVRWLEEPIRGDGVHALVELHERTGLALATGENLYGSEAFEPYLTCGAIDIVQPDVSKVGGVTPYLEIAGRCAEVGVTLNPHLYNGAVATHTTVGLAAALPQTRLLEWDVRENPLRTPVDHLLTAGGTVRAPGAGAEHPLDLTRLAHLEEIA